MFADLPYMFDSFFDSVGSSDKDMDSEGNDYENGSDGCPLTEVPQRFMLEKQIFKEMENFMNSEDFSDIDVKVGEEIFKCHKIVLASWSLYFRGLFMSGMTEVKQGVVELSAIEVEEFRDILKVMYTGQCEINKTNVQGLLYSASYLQILSVEEACVEFIMKTLDRSDKKRNLHYLKISRQLNLTKLANYILSFIAVEYQIYEDCEEFLDSLSFDDMKYLLGSKSLSSSSEDEVCTAMLTWIDFDSDGRRKYAKELVKEIRYLALSNEYMKETFLEHEAVKKNADLEDVRSHCSEYLSAPGLQFEYIGEPVATHRPGQKLVDVIAVCNTTSIDFLGYVEAEDGNFIYSRPVELEKREEDFGKFEDMKPTSISACNCGRSEILVSTGKRMYHFNGLTGVWSVGPEHLISSKNNCLLFDQKTDYIYNVVAAQEMLFIEKCRFDSENGMGVWKMEVQQEIESSAASDFHTRSLNFHAEGSDFDAQVSNFIFQALNFPAQASNFHARAKDFHAQARTCAYIMEDNIFFAKAGVAPEKEKVSVFKYSAVTKSITVIAVLPEKFHCSIAVPHKGFVFLVDDIGEMILRVSEDGHCIEKYGRIGHDKPHMLHIRKQNFGACICNGKLVKIGGRNYNRCIRHRGSKCIVDYDLGMHVTNIQPLHSILHSLKHNSDTVCLKMTVMPRSLK